MPLTHEPFGEWNVPDRWHRPSRVDLRDYFAAAALNGLILHYHETRVIGPDPFKELSGVAYEYADAMLKQREEK
jgi:hypothetical protein